MFVNPPSGLGRFLLGVLVLSSVSYVVLNLVSFGGTSWISYTDVPIRFGLWRVCDTSAEGLCNQWSDNQFQSSVTSNTFPSGKPGFVRSSQALEIISLIFYLIAASLTLIGLFDLDGLSYRLLFLIAAALLFICIIFLSASLGLMSVQGRSNHSFAFLDWAWWNGLVGLIFTILAFITLLAFLADMDAQPSTTSFFSAGQRASNVNNVVLTAPVNPYPTFSANEYPQPFYPSSNPPGMFSYGNVYNPTPLVNSSLGGMPGSSPVISGLAQAYVSRLRDAQFQREILQPYQQYI